MEKSSFEKIHRLLEVFDPRQGHLPLIAGGLGKLNHRLDRAKGVVRLNACLYLAGEESLPPEY